MMNIALIFGLLVLMGVIYFVLSRGRLAFGMASTFEKERNYEAACYLYAVAFNAGYHKSQCHEKIEKLCKEYGPFDFKKQLEEAKAAHCRCNSCGEGAHFLTVSDIRKMVGLKKENSAIS